MPKKKLTKAQVRKKLQRMVITLYDLFTDKMTHPDSAVPMSEHKMLEIYKLLKQALKRMK